MGSIIRRIENIEKRVKHEYGDADKYEEFQAWMKQNPMHDDFDQWLDSIPHHLKSTFRHLIKMAVFTSKEKEEYSNEQ